MCEVSIEFPGFYLQDAQVMKHNLDKGCASRTHQRNKLNQTHQSLAALLHAESISAFVITSGIGCKGKNGMDANEKRIFAVCVCAHNKLVASIFMRSYINNVHCMITQCPVQLKRNLRNLFLRTMLRCHQSLPPRKFPAIVESH